MSQSDYLQHKRTRNVIKIDTITNKDTKPQPPVFSSSQLLNFSQFSLLNRVINTKNILNNITPSGENIIFDMNINSIYDNSCSPFIICEGTNLRTNRVPMSSVYSDPTPLPLNYFEVKQANQIKREQDISCNCINKTLL